MGNNEKIFQRDSVISFDTKHRATLHHNISKYDESVVRGKSRYSRFEEARQYASDIKEAALANLAENLELFEKNISDRGATVLWASDGNDAIAYIRQILLENSARLVVKSKSMITEEVQFNEHAAGWGLETVETDLGEFIVQTAGEKPYHILTPAMHKSKEEVAALFHEKFGTPENYSPAELTAYVREKLRAQFATADVGVTGANFLVADIGGVSLTENEGNALMTVSFPKIHIVIAGIERMIPSVNQLPFFWQWLGVHGTGQNISAYNTLLLGPKSNEENDGPEKMYVILLDNGRSRLLAEKEEWQALKCIRCGACLNACPVYKNVGGYTYSSTYTGPIGSVLTPFYSGFKEFGHLSFASTLCGRCTEVCPVKIPLHELLLLNRKRKVEDAGDNFSWRIGMKAFGFAFAKRRRLDRLSGRWKRRLAKLSPNILGGQKDLPQFTDHSFSELYKIQNRKSEVVASAPLSHHNRKS
jgi:L-lactate dehydrogenase complex protein LldF